MKQTLKYILTVSAKRAIVAASTTLSVVWQDPAKFNLTHWKGIEHVLVTIAAAVGSAEIFVWAPKILAWANTPDPEPKP